MTVSVQAEDFDPGAEMAALSRAGHEIGAVTTFVGLVRDMTDHGRLTAMTLEHYPGMTDRKLEEIRQEAFHRWPDLRAVRIIHRYGRLTPGERIVFVATASPHRDVAFDACRFLIDWLKTSAPFWKLEEADGQARWVEAKTSDTQAAKRWDGFKKMDPTGA